MTANTSAQLKTAYVFLHLFDLPDHNKQCILPTVILDLSQTKHHDLLLHHMYFLNNMKVTFSVNDKSSLTPSDPEN
jgi:hypothetical protein